MEPLLSQFESYLFPSSILSQQLSNLRTNRQMWQEKAETETLPAAAKRPENLTINCASDDDDIADDEIPSPTAFNNKSQSKFDFDNLVDYDAASNMTVDAQSLHLALLDHVNSQSCPSRKSSICNSENDTHLSNLIDLIQLST